MQSDEALWMEIKWKLHLIESTTALRCQMFIPVRAERF